MAEGWNGREVKGKESKGGFDVLIKGWKGRRVEGRTETAAAG